MSAAGGPSGHWQQWRNPAILGLAVVLLVVQEIAVSQISPDGSWAWFRRSLFFVTMPIMVLAALNFRRYAGAWLIAAGITMNFLPMAMHGGNMPVAYETVRDSGAFPEITTEHIGGQIANSKDIVLWRDDVRFAPLSDHIVFTMPGYRTNIYSPGDVVIAAGVLAAAVQAIGAAFGLSPRRILNRRPSDEPAAAR